MKSTENSVLNFEQIIIFKSVSGLKFVREIGTSGTRTVVHIVELSHTYWS